MENTNEQVENVQEVATKFCSECGERINAKAVICPKCGCQVGGAQQAQPQIVINNANQNSNTVVAPQGEAKNKWVAFILCWWFGYLGAHKFYEGKFASGLLYCCTCGLFFFGIVTDFLTLLGKPNPYLVI